MLFRDLGLFSLRLGQDRDFLELRHIILVTVVSKTIAPGAAHVPWPSREETSATYARLRTRRLTCDVCGSNFAALGVMAVRRYRRLLVLFLLAGVFGGSAVLPVDLPETAFDESDAPVNLAPPSQALLRFVPPVSNPLVMPGLRFYCAVCVVGSPVLGAAAMPTHRHPHYSLQELLCTFLI